jgi:hypothetical protein
MLLEVVPLVSIFLAYVLILASTGKPALVASILPALGFALSGLGWFYVGETSLGWKLLAGRVAVVAAAAALGYWFVASVFTEALCETPGCESDTSGPGGTFVLTTAVVWTIALLWPVISAIAIAIWLRRESENE